MFAVVYKFIVKENKSEQFISSWEALTKLIYQFEGSLGSRLHQVDEVTYLAYAQWPNKNTWENSGNQLPREASIHRNAMRDSCSSIETLHKMEMVNDLLKDSTYESK